MPAKYVLITPSRNEEKYIGATIESVVRQVLRPLKYVIVSDGSTDRTDEIAAAYSRQHPWIELVHLSDRPARDFAGKVRAFNAGWERLKGLDYDFVGSLDADITFEPDYFDFLLGKFREDPQLGVAGTPFNEGGGTYNYKFSSVEHVSGACQLFRRQCYEAIGGYVPVRGGGIDVIAVTMARMKGWKTRTFPEKQCFHHRPMGSASHRSKFAAEFQLGERQYRLGFHPLWQTFRSLYQMTKRPYLTGGAALLAGYTWALLRKVERPVSLEFVDFVRQEQMRRLRGFLSRGQKKSGQNH